MNKYNSLKEYLESLGSVAVAFSGGVDSTLLLAAAKEVLGDRVLAVVVQSAFMPKQEYEDAVRLAESLGASYQVLSMDILRTKGVEENPKDRCYICKKAIFESIMKTASEAGITHVIEGSNMDDLADYRPGARAVSELGVLSPLREAGLYKSEIRKISKDLNLPTWDKPAMACLASRFVYGQRITEEELRKVEGAEQFLFNLGYKQLRVRCHGELARIELEPDALESILGEEIKNKVYQRFMDLGFKYVAVDLKGYEMGSMNR